MLINQILIAVGSPLASDFTRYRRQAGSHKSIRPSLCSPDEAQRNPGHPGFRCAPSRLHSAYRQSQQPILRLTPEQETLLDWREQIARYLREHLRLELNPTRQRLQPVSDGVDFLGYIVRGEYRLVRRRVVNHLHERLRDYQTRLVVGP
jgi:hypothetical protein